MEPRLASSVLVAGLMRRAEAEGGFAAVVAKGDATSGAVVVVLAERGRRMRLLERILQPDGRYVWQDMVVAGGNGEEMEKFLARRRKFDPDLWIIELDIASEQRFADAMNAFD